MVMDENGRNGGKWHLAQQTTYHVTLYIFQQLTQHVIIQKQQFTHHVIALSYRYEFGGIFISFISIKKIPPYAIIIIYNLLTNSKSKCSII